MSPAAEDPASAGVSPLGQREADYQAAVRRDLPRNFGAYLVHGMLGQTGFRLINAPTFVPAYVHLLSGSDLVVGLARGLQSLGMFVSPIFSATWIEHRARVLPLGFAVGALMRLQVLGLALAGLLLPEHLNLLAVCSLLGLFGLFLGMQGVIFNFLMSKVIPVPLRGRLVGARNTLAGLVSVYVAGEAGVLVEHNALGNGYAATFLLAFGLTAFGLTMLLFVREPAPPRMRAAASVRERLGDLPALLRSDPAFARYFAARAMGVMGRMAMPFYILLATTRVEMSGEVLGRLTQMFVLFWTIPNFFWGWLADRAGFRATFLAALAVWTGSAVALIHLHDYGALLWAFAGLGLGLGGFQISAQNLVLEFGRREDLPMRIAVANSGSELVGAIGPIAGGLLATAFSYSVVIWTAVVFKIAAMLLVAFGVRDPRFARD